MNSSYTYEHKPPFHKIYTDKVDQPHNTTNSGDEGMNKRRTNKIGNDSHPITSKTDNNIIKREGNTGKTEYVKLSDNNPNIYKEK